jgi:hypothetical protein
MSLFVQRFRYALRNDGRIVVERKHHGTLKAVCPRDEHAKAAFERIGGDPSFVRSLGVFATRDDSRFDALATVAGNPLDVEDRSGIRFNCSGGCIEAVLSCANL